MKESKAKQSVTKDGQFTPSAYAVSSLRSHAEASAATMASAHIAASKTFFVVAAAYHDIFFFFIHCILIHYITIREGKYRWIGQSQCSDAPLQRQDPSVADTELSADHRAVLGIGPAVALGGRVCGA